MTTIRRWTGYRKAAEQGFAKTKRTSATCISSAAALASRTTGPHSIWITRKPPIRTLPRRSSAQLHVRERAGTPQSDQQAIAFYKKAASKRLRRRATRAQPARPRWAPASSQNPYWCDRRDGVKAGMSERFRRRGRRTCEAAACGCPSFRRGIDLLGGACRLEVQPCCRCPADFLLSLSLDASFANLLNRRHRRRRPFRMPPMASNS